MPARGLVAWVSRLMVTVASPKENSLFSAVANSPIKALSAGRAKPKQIIQSDNTARLVKKCNNSIYE